MQKLFSMFPRGAPGIALLLLRLFVGLALICDARVFGRRLLEFGRGLNDDERSTALP